MCRQDYGECMNLNCKGKAQILDLRPCGNRPNCEIKYDRVSRNRDGEPFCPDCRNLPGRERKNQTQRALRAAKKSGKADTAVAAGLGGAQAAAVEQQGESSTTGESRPVTLGGEFDPSTDDFFAGPEETGEPLLPQDEDRDWRPNPIGDSAPGPRLPEPRPSTPQMPIDPALLHVDRILSSGSDRARNMQDAQQFLADLSSGSNNPGDKDGEESSDSKNPSEKKE